MSVMWFWSQVHFLCVDELVQSTLETAIPSDTEMCFATNRTCDVLGHCDFDSRTSAYVCPSSPVDWSTVESPPVHCAFDNGFNIPPVPSFDAPTSVCRNAVVGVEYNFTWSGQTVTRLNATVTLADVRAAATVATAVASSAKTTVVSQRFVVTFVGNTSQTPLHNSSSADKSNMVYPPSGNPGKF